MQNVLAISRIFFFFIMSISFAVIAYSQYENAQASKVQAVSLVVLSSGNFNNAAFYTSEAISAGFSIKEAYTHVYNNDISGNKK